MTSLRLRREGIHGVTIRGYRVRGGRLSHRGIGRSWLVHRGDGRKGGRRRGCHGHRPHRTGGFPPPSARGSATRRRRSAARAAPPYARIAPRRGRCPQPHVDRLLRATGTRPRSAAFGADDRLDRAGASPDVARTRSPLPARRSHAADLRKRHHPAHRAGHAAHSGPSRRHARRDCDRTGRDAAPDPHGRRSRGRSHPLHRPSAEPRLPVVHRP